MIYIAIIIGLFAFIFLATRSRWSCYRLSGWNRLIPTVLD